MISLSCHTFPFDIAPFFYLFNHIIISFLRTFVVPLTHVPYHYKIFFIGNFIVYSLHEFLCICFQPSALHFNAYFGIRPFFQPRIPKSVSTLIQSIESVFVVSCSEKFLFSSFWIKESNIHSIRLKL